MVVTLSAIASGLRNRLRSATIERLRVFCVKAYADIDAAEWSISILGRRSRGSVVVETISKSNHGRFDVFVLEIGTFRTFPIVLTMSVHGATADRLACERCLK
jgi:hypothetical protein